MVFCCHFMNLWSWGYLQNEHWNGPKIKKLYFWSWSSELVLGNFLHSELFNGELFTPAFRIYLYFCQKHTPKSRKFNVCLILPAGMGSIHSCEVKWRVGVLISVYAFIQFMKNHVEVKHVIVQVFHLGMVWANREKYIFVGKCNNQFFTHIFLLLLFCLRRKNI